MCNQLELASQRCTLRSLLKDLDNTYARISQGIGNGGSGDQVAKIMKWLAYLTRPLFLTEVAEIMTVNVEEDPRVDIKRPLEYPQDLLAICSRLVSAVCQRVPWYLLITPEVEKEQDIVHFPHFSIRECSNSLLFGRGQKPFPLTLSNTWNGPL